MPNEVMVAIIGMLGSGLGAFGGVLINSKLTTYRLEQLEKKVDKHNSVMERTFRLEERMTAADHRLDDLEKKAG